MTVVRIEPGDTLVVGDRRRTQPLAVEAGVSCLIVTGGAQPEPRMAAGGGAGAEGFSAAPPAPTEAPTGGTTAETSSPPHEEARS